MPRCQAGSWPVLGVAVLLALAVLTPAASFAQSPPPPSEATPPEVVGWIEQTSGSVWVASGSGKAWEPPAANEPISDGEAISTAPDGQATIMVMSMRAMLGPSSELGIQRIGAQSLTAVELSGEVALDLSALPAGASVAIGTPRGIVEIATPGRYAISAGGGDRPTLVTALEGSARIVSGSDVETIGPGQTASLTGGSGGAFSVAIGPARPDPLLQALIASAPPPPTVAPPPAVAEMTGGVDLAAYGAWTVVPAYGTVWFPDVAVGWVPYRYGQWLYIAPWGWTWCDDDPWGFAPFHYGRWVRVGPRWGWVPVGPGIAVSAGVPVYAPALVHFFGAGPKGGWVPLGPGEVYRPPYRASPAYVRSLNRYDVRNWRTIAARPGPTPAIGRFADRGALTYVPHSVLAGLRPVAPAFGHSPPGASPASLHSLPAGAPPAPHGFGGARRTAAFRPTQAPPRRPTQGRAPHSLMAYPVMARPAPHFAPAPHIAAAPHFAPAPPHFVPPPHFTPAAPHFAPAPRFAPAPHFADPPHPSSPPRAQRPDRRPQ